MDEFDFRALIKLSQNYSTTVIIFDKKYDVLYCNKKYFIPDNAKLTDYSKDELDQMRVPETMLLLVRGVEYCANIVPFDDVFFCELFDFKTLSNFAKKGGVYQKIFPYITAMEHNFSRLWQTIGKIRKNIPEGTPIEWHYFLNKIESDVAYIHSVSKSACEYAHLKFYDFGTEKVDAYEITRGVIQRCNDRLEKCGRKIKFKAVKDDYPIYASTRHYINAIVCGIQNALLFSPEDTVPVFMLYREEVNNIPYGVFKISNVRRTEPSEDRIDPANCFFQRINSGLAIMRDFAERSGGEIFIDEKVDEFVVKMRIHLIVNPNKNMLYLEQSYYRPVATGIPDFVDLKMMEILDIFRKE